MPRFRKLSEAEIATLERRPPGVRTQVAREFDAYPADFAAGDYGRGDLAEGERRTLEGYQVSGAGYQGSEQDSLASESRHPAPRRPPRRPSTAAERYHRVLPRWMREGQPGRPAGSRRRER